MNIQSISNQTPIEMQQFGKGNKTHKPKHHRVDKTRIRVKREANNKNNTTIAIKIITSFFKEFQFLRFLIIFIELFIISVSP